MSKHYKLGLVLLIDFIMLVFVANSLSISVYEINELHTNEFNSYFANLSIKIFGKENIRFLYILLHLLSNLLLYKISFKYLKQEAYLANIIYNLCPGVVASAVLVNSAGIIIFISLLLILLDELKYQKSFFIVLIGSIFISKAMLIFIFACMFYSYFKRKHNLFIISSILFLFGLGIHGYNFSGKPKSYFLDTLAISSAVFSPPLFLYFFYTIYFVLFKGKKDLLFYVSSTSFLLCLALSIRQRPEIGDFLPFMVLAVPLMIDNFLSSYRVHLPQFRLKHRIIIIFTLFSLGFSYVIIVFNPFLYLFVEQNEHFAKSYHLSKEIATELKKRNITELNANSFHFRELKFYGIKECKKDCISLIPCTKGELDIEFFTSNFNFCLKKH